MPPPLPPLPSGAIAHTSMAQRSFPLPTRAPSYYLGHMARSLRQLPTLLQEDIDIVLEARDARLPLSGVNSGLASVVRRSWGQAQSALPSFNGSSEASVPIGAGPSTWAGASSAYVGDAEGKGKGRMRERVVVYTKRDLADERFEEPLTRAFWQHARQRVFFANTGVDKDVKDILKHLVDLAQEHAKQTGNPDAQTNILVVGMPNVGKSSFLNALRRVGVHKGKAFRTSSHPGHTRKLTGTVRVFSEPDLYVYDTPGVMMPYLGKGALGVEKGLKLALTGGIKEGLFSEETVAEFLLYLLNTHHYLASRHTGDDTSIQFVARIPPDQTYLSRLGLQEGRSIPPLEMDDADAFSTEAKNSEIILPTDSLPVFLTALARRLGTLRKGGEPDIDAAQTHFLRVFREGKLGPITVDNLGRGLMRLESDAEGDRAELTTGAPDRVGEGLRIGDVDDADYLGEPEPSAARQVGPTSADDGYVERAPGSTSLPPSGSSTSAISLSPGAHTSLDATVYAAVRSFLLAEEERAAHGETSSTQRRKREVERVKTERRDKRAIRATSGSAASGQGKVMGKSQLPWWKGGKGARGKGRGRKG